MKRYILKRVSAALPVMWGVATLVFLLLHIVPGNPIDILLGENALPAERAALEKSLNLDKPLYVQYGLFLSGLVKLDLGTSIHTREPVRDKLLRRFPATFVLALAAMAVAIFIAVPLGTAAALKQYSWIDNTSVLFSLIGVSMPSFWLGPLLILLFSVKLGWFPVSGYEGPSSIVLPAVTLGVALAAVLSRMIRSCMLDQAGEDFVRTAKAKGVSPAGVTIRHMLRNALIPVITLMGLQMGALLTGAIIVEKVFGWPGMGMAMVEAVEQRDYPVVQGGVILISFCYVMVNLITDLIYAAVDPRVRYEK